MRSEEYTFEGSDGAQLFYRAWKSENCSRALVLLHRGHEHSGRWSEVVDRLGLEDTAIFAWDARGHGNSPGPRGDAECFGTLVADLDAFMRHLSATHGIALQDMVLLGHSVGGVIATTWVHDYAPPIRGLILSNPAYRVRLYVPFAITGLRVLNRLNPSAFITSYVKGRLLTRDPARQLNYDNDPRITQRISVRVLLGLYDAGTRLLADTSTIDLPVLMMSSGADFVVHQAPQFGFFDGLPNSMKRLRIFPGFRHDMFSEMGREKPIAEVESFVRDLFSEKITRAQSEQSYRYGVTQSEYEKLCAPLPVWSPRAWAFSVTRLMLRTVGRVSEGMRLGLSKGFDSGEMLDYVYCNEARGTSALGRFLDRIYLNSAGWVGIRARKENIEGLLVQAIAEVQTTGKVPHIVDLAAGRGRYVIDALEKYPGTATAALYDICPDNVKAGTAALGVLDNRITFARGDAFDADQVQRATKDADIVVISGLFELFSDNSLVARSLNAMASHRRRNVFLIYTNQPWHPQLEFIARVLTSHRAGQAWIMRRRAQAEMDKLVLNAGFKKVRQLIDPAGIFSVSLASRV